jgi:aminopeptidase N
MPFSSQNGARSVRIGPRIAVCRACRAALALALPLVLPLVLLAAARVEADTYPRNARIDILNYVFQLEVTDTSDAIAGEATIDVRLRTDALGTIELDLANAAGRTDGRGMTVESVTVGGRALRFTHDGDRLRVALQESASAGSRVALTIRYRGTPAGGLLIGPNKRGERVFASDNWPDKAHQWLPLIDHPSDKATAEFIVIAPAAYQVVSNGVLVEQTDLDSGVLGGGVLGGAAPGGGGRRRTHWKQSVPIAPWLYTLGIARYAVHYDGSVDGRPIQSWVYAAYRDAGFRDFPGPTRAALEYFSDRIGPYAYEKLANVQSAAVGGGMEAASAIGYGEDLITGERSRRVRNVIIHEIAHQWFGNAVTEADWDDVWLSEGFATYFTTLFIGHAYGRDEFLAELRRSRDTVLEFDGKNPEYRVIHDRLSDMSKVTSPQTYQKGSWTLHMLRGLIGDAAFWSGIRTYYRTYLNATASTEDFRRVMEEASRQELGWFFDQWLRRGGVPKLRGRWRYDAAAKQIAITLEQQQPGGDPFRLPLDLAIRTAGQHDARVTRIEMRSRTQEFLIPSNDEPTSVELDPESWILMDATFESALAPAAARD